MIPMFNYANMLVLKVTRDCNLRCKYCYLADKDDYKNELVSFDMFKKITNKIIEDKRKSGANTNFSIVFHGGEPTLAGVKNLAKMMDYAVQKGREGGIEITFGIQTNLTLIDDEMAALFSKYDVSTGFSFDGINDGNKNRTKSFDNDFFAQKLKLLNDYHVKKGGLIVANKQNINNLKESVDYLANTLGLHMTKINYVEDVLNEVSEVEISGEEFFEKSLKVFIDSFIEKGKTEEENTNCLITDFIISKFICNYRHRSNCYTKVCGAGVNVIEMNPSGETYLCGRYAKDYPEAYIMNIEEYDFLGLKQYTKYLWFVKQKHAALMEAGCDTCIADEICDHGCMAFHFSKYGKYGIRKELACGAYKKAYLYLEQRFDDIMDTYFKHVAENGKIAIRLSGGNFVAKNSSSSYEIELKDSQLFIQRR